MSLDILDELPEPMSTAPMTFYRDRFRGGPRAVGVFLIYRDHEADVFHVEPVGYAPTPDQLRSMLLEEGRLSGVPQAGGRFDRQSFNFTMLAGLRPRDIPSIFVRLFATLGANANSDAFAAYLDAQILVDSEPAGFGTIRDVLGLPKLLLN